MTYVQKGSTGDRVKLLQILLSIEVTGTFDEKTDEAVRQFQRENNLTEDGIVGKNTLQKLTGLKYPRHRWITEVVVHCTATEEGEEHSAKEIDRWHKARGWNGIGYHYVIHLDGSIEEGRNIDLSGAHTVGHNSNSIGVVYVGGYRNGEPADTRTPEQKASMMRLLRELMWLNSLAIAKIRVHNEFAKKACPCFTKAQLHKELEEDMKGNG